MRGDPVFEYGPARRWIIRKGDRRCSGWGCGGPCAVKLADDVRGTLQTKCKDCGHEEEKTSTEFFSRRPCGRCGDFRDVRVRIWKDMSLSEKAGRDVFTEHFEEHCEICRLEISAASHLSTAKAFLARAKVMRAARKERAAAERATDGGGEEKKDAKKDRG